MWKLKPDDRLEHWKQCRRRISNLPVDQALLQCYDLWASAPFTPFYLEHDRPDNWPDPWQLVYENYYCDLAKCLGMLYTIHLSDHAASLNLGMRIYYDPISRANYNLVWIDEGKYVLNFSDEGVVNKKQIPTELKLLREFTNVELELDRY